MVHDIYTEVVDFDGLRFRAYVTDDETMMAVCKAPARGMTAKWLRPTGLGDETVIQRLHCRAGGVAWDLVLNLERGDAEASAQLQRLSDRAQSGHALIEFVLDMDASGAHRGAHVLCFELPADTVMVAAHLVALM